MSETNFSLVTHISKNGGKNNDSRRKGYHSLGNHCTFLRFPKSLLGVSAQVMGHHRFQPILVVPSRIPEQTSNHNDCILRRHECLQYSIIHWIVTTYDTRE